METPIEGSETSAAKQPSPEVTLHFMDIKWVQPREVQSAKWDCYFCGAKTGSDRGYTDEHKFNVIRLCLNCGAPAYFPIGSETPVPRGLPGEQIASLPKEVAALYAEARSAIQAHANTAAVMVCRTILSHTAVERGAAQGLKFAAYVEYLSSAGYVPPNGRAWVDYIRDKGNEAIHEIVIFEEKDSKLVLQFTAQLLRNVYELPAALPPV